MQFFTGIEIDGSSLGEGAGAVVLEESLDPADQSVLDSEHVPLDGVVEAEAGKARPDPGEYLRVGVRDAHHMLAA